MNRIQELMSQFVQLYRAVLPNKNTAKIIHDLNSGLCYFVATEIGNVLKKEGYEVNLCSNVHHAWLNLDGVDYDTLYPEGYPQNVAKEWLLPEMGFGTNAHVQPFTDTPIQDVNASPYYNDLRLIQKLWREHHGIEAAKQHGPASPMTHRKTKRLMRRVNKVDFTKFNKEPLPPKLVPPFTHFTYDSEEPQTRQLKPYPFMRPVAVYKFLFEDFRINGTHMQQM